MTSSLLDPCTGESLDAGPVGRRLQGASGPTRHHQPNTQDRSLMIRAGPGTDNEAFPEAETNKLAVPRSGSISLRQLARYEAGDQQPVLSAAVALADALGISMDQLAGKVTYGLNLSGDWWCAWQTWKDGAPRIDTHPLEVHQQGEVLQLNAERAVPVAEGSYRWRGELRLWDNEALIGWYRSTDAAVRSKGTLYLALHRHGTYRGTTPGAGKPSVLVAAGPGTLGSGRVSGPAAGSAGTGRSGPGWP